MTESTSECTASLNMAAEPLTAAAMNLARVTSKLPASAAHTHFASKEILGEITLVIAGAALAAAAEPWDVEDVRAELSRLLADGALKKKDAARLVAEQSGWPARELYRLAAEITPAGVPARPASAARRTGGGIRG